MAPLPKFLVAGLVIVAFAIGSVSPSAASCAAPVSVDYALGNADLVVVGTVTATRSRNRIATVAVEDIWKGDADSVIEVAGGSDQPNMATSVDRTYEVGTRYLFFIFEPALHGSAGTFGARYEDACSNTRLYTSDLDEFRPASARRTPGPATTPSTLPPSTTTIPGSNDGDGAVVVVLGVAAAIVSAALAAVIWRVRRRGSTAGQ